MTFDYRPVLTTEYSSWCIHGKNIHYVVCPECVEYRRQEQREDDWRQVLIDLAEHNKRLADMLERVEARLGRVGA